MGAPFIPYPPNPKSPTLTDDDSFRELFVQVEGCSDDDTTLRVELIFAKEVTSDVVSIARGLPPPIGENEDLRGTPQSGVYASQGYCNLRHRVDGNYVTITPENCSENFTALMKCNWTTGICGIYHMSTGNICSTYTEHWVGRQTYTFNNRCLGLTGIGNWISD